MITKWKLSNFKSIRYPTELSLSPLTIFVGPNSSGKSTIIQSILLISQTLSSKVRSRSVVLNGHLARLGQFDDLRSFGGTNSTINIGWQCVDYSNPKTVTCEISFDVDPDTSQPELMQLQPRLLECLIEYDKEHPRQEPRPPEHASIRLTRLSSKNRDELRAQSGPEMSSSSFGVHLDDEVLREIKEFLPSAEVLGCDVHHFLPDHLYVRYDHVEQEAKSIVASLFQQIFRVPIPGVRGYINRNVQIPPAVVELLRSKLQTTMAPLLPPLALELFGGASEGGQTLKDWSMAIRRLGPQERTTLQKLIQDMAPEIIAAAKRGKDRNFQITTLDLPEGINDAVEYLDNFFSESVKYLGPLRDEPKALYPLAATVDPFDVGLRGEYTAAALDLHRVRPTRYYPPASLQIESMPTEFATVPLEAAVLDWLRYLGVADEIQTRDRGKIGHELKVVTSLAHKQNDLTHVGVGVSQVLPILVMCLLADPDTTLILEQPELHLHPRVQTLLADFFLSMALIGKQCIIETHSEYIINRLRLRTALVRDGDLSTMSKLYFVEPKDGASSIREVVVNKYGAILDWPEGFFDESQREAEEILKAASVKHRLERGAV